MNDMYCPKCGEEMDDKNSTGGHICYRTVSVRAVSIKNNYDQLRAERQGHIDHIDQLETEVSRLEDKLRGQVEIYNRLLDQRTKLQAENKKLKVFALKLVENEEELESLDYWAEEYLHAYGQLSKIAEFEAENKKLKKFEDYSYYVGTEITCGRMPHKYSWWLDSLKGE